MHETMYRNAMLRKLKNVPRIFGLETSGQQPSRGIHQSASRNSMKADAFLQDGYADSETEPLYENHVRLSRTQRALMAIGSGIMALNDPYRDDMVARFAETTGRCSLQNIYHKMSDDPEGSQILREKPRINTITINMESLADLPPNTFGYNYYHFMKDNNITPDSRKQVRFVDDPELAFVCQRYREVHDLVHCVLSMPTNMLGEVIVKWVEAIQTGLPMCWLGGLFGAVKLNAKARQVYVNQGLPWALKCGHEAKNLMCIYYEKRFEQDFAELKRELNIPKPPVIGKMKSHVDF